MGSLSEVSRRRIAALILVAGIVMAVLAITDTGPFEDPPTEEERVSATVSMLYGAASDGDFKAYCSLLTPSARRAIRAQAARLLAQAGDLRCAQILGAAGDAFAGLRLQIRHVSVSGNRARVEANVRLRGVRYPEARTVMLEQGKAGEWVVSDPG